MRRGSNCLLKRLSSSATGITHNKVVKRFMSSVHVNRSEVFSEEESKRAAEELARIDDRRNFIVKLEGFSRLANRHDINSFLTSCGLTVDPMDVRLGHNKKLRLCGDWYIVLNNTDEILQVRKAVDDNLKTMTYGSIGNPLKVSKIVDWVYTAGTRFFPYQNDGRSVLIYQLPYHVEESLIHKFFHDGYELEPNGIIFGKHAFSPMMNMAMVRFASSNDASRAVREKNGQPLNNNVAEICRYEG